MNLTLLPPRADTYTSEYNAPLNTTATKNNSDRYKI